MLRLMIFSLLFGFVRVWTVQAEQRQPNILFILVDDLGYGDPRCYGGNRIPTPGIDRLAREGLLFTQYYQCGSVCSPSRASLMTGMWPSDVSVFGHFATPANNAKRGMPDFLDPSLPTLPRILQKGGYKTLHVGKWHLGRPKDSGESLDVYGFDEAHWIDCNHEGVSLWKVEQRPIASKVLVEKTIEVIEKNKSTPFYCQLWLDDPHALLAPSEEQMEPFRNKNAPKNFTTPHQVYAATVAEMDRQILRLLVKLDELNLARDTIVIFSSDNGPEDIEIGNASWSGLGSAGPLRGRKRSLYEGGIRVPFIIRWPAGGIPAGKINRKSVVSGADLLPTLCALTQVDVPDAVSERIRGQSMAPAFTGTLDFVRDRPIMWEWRYKVFNHRWNCSPILAVRDGKWKLLFNPDKSRVELYDMELDPYEERNLAHEHAAIVERLQQMTLVWQRSLPESTFDPEAGTQPAKWPQEGAGNSVKPRVDRNVYFDRSDADKDNRLSRDEYLGNFGKPGNKRRAIGEERFPLFDNNGDGWLSREEFIQMGR